MGLPIHGIHSKPLTNYFPGSTFFLTMGDFPKGGDIEATRAWLDKKGFHGVFIGWEADAILGQEEADIIGFVGTEAEGLRLWGFLNTARQSSQSSM